MSPAVAKVLSRLKGVKRSGKGWMALCPAHADHDPSLRIDEGNDGRALLTCYADCRTEDVLTAIGLTMGDLFVESSRRQTETRSRQDPEAVYDYVDESGKLLFQVVRFPGKQFRQRRPDGAGGWTWKLDGVERVLYRLPEVIQAVKAGETVFICEGEKDVDRLRSLGLTATTNAGGAGKWQESYNQFLKDADVIILPDNDPPGRKHGLQVAQEVGPMARTVKIVHLPDLPERGDVSDWLNAGGTAEKLQELAEGAMTLFGRTPSLTCVADVEREETVWLWHNRIPLRKLTLIEGDPGEGKTWLTHVLAANITRGWPLPDDEGNTFEREPGSVVLLSAEDGAGDTIRPRLEDAEANLERVFLLTGSQEEPDEGMYLDRDLDLLEATARKVKPLLVVVDPLQAYLGASVDMHRANETRPVLAALGRFAERHGCAVVIVRHLRKTSGDRAIYRGIGSIDFTGAARSVLRVGKDPQDPRRRVIASVKSNLGPEPESLAFTIEEGQFRWLGTSKVTAEAMDMPQDEETRTKLEEAIDFLKEELADGPRPSRELIREAKKQLDISERTLKTAKASLDIEHFRESGKGRAGQWFWKLNEDSSSLDEGQRTSEQVCREFSFA
jgi:putative DNA primase/helicase